MRVRPAAILGAFVVAALSAGTLPSPAADNRDPLRPLPGPPRPPEFVEAVNRAIDRGVAWLRKTQDEKGGFGGLAPSRQPAVAYSLGYTALGLYTMRACGVPADDPAVVLGFQRLRRIFDERLRANALTNYEVSLALLALDAHYVPPDGAAGGGNRSRKPVPRNIPDADRTWIRNMASWICHAQGMKGGFGYDSPAASWEDNSNTQYSLLGLKAARRLGAEVPRVVFRRTLDLLVDSQERTGDVVERKETVDAPSTDGKGKNYGSTSRAATKDHARGWGYGNGRSRVVSGSMTAAGVSSMVICRGEMLGNSDWKEAADAAAVRSIRDGIAWLGHSFSVKTNPGGGGNWHYYYLYGLERAGILAGVTWMASKDWYLEGADYLVAQQAQGGAWGGPGIFGGMGVFIAGAGGNHLDTCFALLFLKKATFRVEGAVATEEPDTTLDLTGIADLDDATYRAIFDTVFAKYLRTDAAGRAERAVDFVRMGTRALGLLVLGLEAEAEGDRTACIEALHRITGLTQGYDPVAAPEVRSAAVTVWEEWYFARRRGLIADIPAGRFREAGGK